MSSVHRRELSIQNRNLHIIFAFNNLFEKLISRKKLMTRLNALLYPNKALIVM